MIAAVNNHIEIINMVLKYSKLDDVNKLGYSALMLASNGAHLQSVRILIEAGANLNLGNEDGNTAFIFSAMKGMLPMVQYFLQFDVEINVRNKKGYTALGLALKQEYYDVALVIEEAGGIL